MEQIFMIELLIKQIVFKIDSPKKDEYELKMEAEEKKRAAELKAARDLAAARKDKKKKKKKAKNKKGKKKKKKAKDPVLHDGEKHKFLNSCLVQANCLPVFNFFVAHDNFVPPPPPVVEKIIKKGMKKKPKPKKKEKKGKKPKPFVKKLQLPLEVLPHPPFFGVGSSIIFVSRPSALREIMKTTPLYMSVWNRDQNMECIGFCSIDWHSSFIECLLKAEEMKPADMDKGEFRNTKKPVLISSTIETAKTLECEDYLKPCGEIELFIRLSCLGNRLLSSVTTVPEIERHYIADELNLKKVEVARNWEHSTLRNAPAVAYFYGAPDIVQKTKKIEKEVTVVEDYVADFSKSELAIMSMGFPKGPCGGVNCPMRMSMRGCNFNFVHGKEIEGRYIPGTFVNEKDVHGPCGRIDCPLAVLVRSYLRKEGAYRNYKKPCAGDYY